MTSLNHDSPQLKPLATVTANLPVFDHLDVLIDSHDLSLSQGTGIRSYGLNLIAALKSLGGNPELLVSARVGSSPVVSRALLYDSPLRRERVVPGRIKAYKQMLRMKWKSAAHIPPNGGADGVPVPDTVFPFGLGCSSLFNCYVASQTIQRRFKRQPIFKTDKKYHVWHATQPLSLRHEKAVQVTTIHDLIPLIQPHLCDADRSGFHRNVQEAIRSSRAIAVVSEKTKKDLQQYFSVPEEKLVVTYQFSPISRQPCEELLLEQALRMFDLERGRYILFVGTLDIRKNLRRLIDAYLMLGGDVPLVLAGKMGWGVDDEMRFIQRLHPAIGRDIRLLDYVPACLMSALYQGAGCLAFPSLYEGFGLPVLEAMASGCPVVCSSSSSLPEVAGDAAHYVDPLDEESISQGLAKVLGDADYRAMLVGRGRARSAFFSEEQFQAQIAELYRRALA